MNRMVAILCLAALLPVSACAPAQETYLEHRSEYGTVVSRTPTEDQTQTYVVHMIDGKIRSVKTRNVIAIPGDCVHVGSGDFRRVQTARGVCGTR